MWFHLKNGHLENIWLLTSYEESLTKKPRKQSYTKREIFLNQTKLSDKPKNVKNSTYNAMETLQYVIVAFNEKWATDLRNSNKSSHFINDSASSRKTEAFHNNIYNCRWKLWEFFILLTLFVSSLPEYVISVCQ